MENLNIFITWLSLFSVMISMAIASQNSTSSKTEGQLIVAGDTVQIKHAYAMAQPGFFDESKEDIVLIVTNIPLTDKAIEDLWERNTLVSEGTLKTVEVTINSEQQPISVSVKHPAFQASPSGSSTNYILELKTFNEKTVEGRMYCKNQMEFFDTAYRFDFTFKAEVRRKKELPPPTEEEKATAANSPQAAVYLAFVEAVNAGDVNTLKKVLAADVARELDGPEGKDMLGSSSYLIQAQFEKCQHGLHPQPNGGPFSVFLFCDDALGSNIGVILTQPGAGPGNIKLNDDQIWNQWDTSDRFWQDNLWATDVVNFLWSPSLRYLYVATSGVYGDGGFFKLDLQAHVSECVLPDTSENYFSGLKTGYLTSIEKVDTKNEVITIGIYSYDETRTLIATEDIPLE